MSSRHSIPGPLCPCRHSRPRLRRRTTTVFIALLLSLGGVFFPPPASAEAWTSVDGTSTIEARLVGLWGQKAILQTPEGKRITVHVDRLNAESRIRARAVNQKRIDQRGRRIEELKKLSSAESAPCPDPLPVAPDPKPYESPSPNLSPDQTCSFLNRQIESGHLLLAVWDLMPDSYRSDVEATFQRRSGLPQVNAALDSLAPVYRVVDLVVKRQWWIASAPSIKHVGLDRFVTNKVVPAASLLRDLLDPAKLDMSEIGKSMTVRQWIARLDHVLAAHNDAFADFTPQLHLEVVSQEAETARLALVAEDQKLFADVISIEGRWIPKPMADEWANAIERSGQFFESLDKQGSEPEQLAGRKSIDDAVDGVLNPIREIEDVQEFHAMVDGVVVNQVAPMLQMLTQTMREVDARLHATQRDRLMDEGMDLEDEFGGDMEDEFDGDMEDEMGDELEL